MACTSVRDVLDVAKFLHHRLSEYYEQLSASDTRERIRLLLDYMSRHESRLEEEISRFQRAADAPILKHWFKGDIRIPDLLHEEPVITADMDPARVVAMALRYDDAFIALYGRIAASSAPTKVKEFFSNLLQHERREERRLARDTIEMEEV